MFFMITLKKEKATCEKTRTFHKHMDCDKSQKWIHTMMMRCFRAVDELHDVVNGNRSNIVLFRETKRKTLSPG